MDLKGLCSICGKPDAFLTCILCGKIVCKGCYDLNNNICSKCSL